MPLGGLVVLGVGAGLKAYGEHKKGKQADKAAADQARLNNEEREARRLASMKILAGLEGSGWDPFGVNQLTSGSTGTSTTSDVRDTYSKENPFTTAEYSKLDELVRGVMTDRLSRGSSLPPGYEANAIRKINAAAAGGDAAARNAAARKGFSGAQVFGLNAPMQATRTGQIADLRGSVPLLERQLANEDISLEGSRQAQFGTGRERTERSTGRSTTNSSQSGFGDRAPDIGALSSLLMPPGAQQSTVSPYSGSGNAFSALGSAAMGAAPLFAGGGGGAASSAGKGSTPAGQCPPNAPGVYPFCF